MYKYLFGPVPSRRLGMSLGVDLVPKKVCTLDCVYCEVGKTTRLTLEKKEYIPLEKIKAELTHYFKNNPDPDFFTFSGYGEPTLNNRLGDVIQFIKKIKPSIPIAVLTNGTLLSDPEVRNALMKASVVLPSLDAGTQQVFERINRPAKDLNINTYIQGIVDFQEAFTGQLWLEVLILPGYNDTEAELEAIKMAIERIKPDSVQLNTLDRPGTVSGLTAASEEQLKDISRGWNMKNVSIIAKASGRKKMPGYRKDVETTILETIARRPCTLDDLSGILGLHLNELGKYLDALKEQSKITTQKGERGMFYRINED